MQCSQVKSLPDAAQSLLRWDVYHCCQDLLPCLTNLLLISKWFMLPCTATVSLVMQVSRSHTSNALLQVDGISGQWPCL